MRKCANDSYIFKNPVMRNEVREAVRKSKLTLVPAGPRCPSGPFRHSRESHRRSSVMHTKSTGKEVSMHTDAHTVAYQMLQE